MLTVFVMLCSFGPVQSLHRGCFVNILTTYQITLWVDTCPSELYEQSVEDMGSYWKGNHVGVRGIGP